MRFMSGFTGWRPWWVPTKPEIRPYPVNGVIEAWLKDGKSTDPAHSDFWRASPDARLFLLRGYQEDSDSAQLPPGKYFDFTLPMWRVGECLNHAENLAAALGDPSAVAQFSFSWRGLSGRELISWNRPDRDIRDGRVSHQETVTTSISVPADQISSTMPELVHKVTQPLFVVFDFLRVGVVIVTEEIERMRG